MQRLNFKGEFTTGTHVTSSGLHGKDRRTQKRQ